MLQRAAGCDWLHADRVHAVVAQAVHQRTGNQRLADSDIRTRDKAGADHRLPCLHTGVHTQRIYLVPGEDGAAGAWL